jgi:transcriptional regulator with XRE-family HTH domain
VAVNGPRIRTLLAENRWKQATLARQLKVDPTLLSRQLSGDRPMDWPTLGGIAAVLHVPWSSLISTCTGCGQPVQRANDVEHADHVRPAA